LKILFVATVPEHFEYFYVPYFEMLNAGGWEVYTACCGTGTFPACEKNYQLSITRSPLKPANLKALFELKHIIGENDFDIIHCNTPVGGVLARIAAIQARKKGTRIIYTAHGFHFYRGAPLAGWLVFYPVEKVLSRLTDCLVTINAEDYETAVKKLKAKKTVFIQGVGYDDGKYFKPSGDDKRRLRLENGFCESDILLVYVAELNANKNQALLIRAMAIISAKYPEARLLLVGPDSDNGQCRRLVRSLGLEDKVIFTGRRDDVERILPMCDVGVASSLREGLPVNIMEALACGLPVVASDNRGHRALVKNGENGFITGAHDTQAFADAVIKLLSDASLYHTFSEHAAASVGPNARSKIAADMKKLYDETFSDCAMRHHNH